MTVRRITYGVGAHEPIWHRLRTGNSTSDEWKRWHYETSDENLDALERLGVGVAHLACTKGFGLEYEKPLIERAARFAERAAQRGIETSIYVQGFPVYYETFLREVPEAIDWLGRQQDGDFIPWGGQTFRRFMDPNVAAFHDYQHKLLTYVLQNLRPTAGIFMDNTIVPPSWHEASRAGFQRYLKEKFADADPVALFGIAGFDAVDLPRFDPIYYPRDAYRIVKDPLLQEWAYWRSKVVCDFLAGLRKLVHDQAPGVAFNSGVMRCDGLRYNILFTSGDNPEDRLEVLDGSSVEESGWRPKVVDAGQGALQVVKDERHPDAHDAAESSIRVSTDARYCKIVEHYGHRYLGSFWGETNRAAKLTAVCHNMAMSHFDAYLGTVGPLAAPRQMLDDVNDVLAWGNEHLEVLTGRHRRVAPLVVWRGIATTAFIRHRPVWAACAVEQMLFENHLPFTIVFDGRLEAALKGARLLILPGTECVSDTQVEQIRRFVQGGGKLLLLGAAGTRDERTRLRRTHAFADFFGGALPNLEYFGPPHWVPELDFSAMPERLSAACGAGTVTALKELRPRTEPDLTRDVYMPERQVMAKDVLPPANEPQILRELDALLGASVPRLEAPRWTLCEYWQRGGDLLVACANLHRQREGGPATLRLGPYRAEGVQVHQLFRPGVQSLAVRDGAVRLESLSDFAVFVVPGVLEAPAGAKGKAQ